MDQEILRVFFYDVRCAVIVHFSTWSAVYWDGDERQTADMLQTVWNELDFRVDVYRLTEGVHTEHL